jgi:hypothetical protein
LLNVKASFSIEGTVQININVHVQLAHEDIISAELDANLKTGKLLGPPPPLAVSQLNSSTYIYSVPVSTHVSHLNNA